MSHRLEIFIVVLFLVQYKLFVRVTLSFIRLLQFQLCNDMTDIIRVKCHLRLGWPLDVWVECRSMG